MSARTAAGRFSCALCGTRGAHRLVLPCIDQCFHQSHCAGLALGACQLADSRTRAVTTGRRKHSVFPDPVPVVTTTSLPFTTDCSNDSCWCVYSSRGCPFGRVGGKSPKD